LSDIDVISFRYYLVSLKQLYHKRNDNTIYKFMTK
jgi:hypothetical protein